MKITHFAIPFIWTIFTFLFSYMAYKEYKMSNSGIKVKNINVGFSDLNEAYDIIRRAIIQADKNSHKSAAISYLLAALTGLFSLVFSILS